MNRLYTVSLFTTAFLFSSNLTSPAWAYLDPGTGSMILQVLLGGVAGAMVVGRLYWTKVKSFFGRADGAGETETDR